MEWCNIHNAVPRTGEVERVDEAEGSGTSSTTGGQVTSEVAPELGLGVNTAEEDLLVLVFEGEVQGLGGEVPGICQNLSENMDGTWFRKH